MYAWLQLNALTDLDQLSNVVSEEYQPAVVASRLASGMSPAVKAILIEANYLDKDYRSTYYNFYAKKGQHYRKDCVRLHLFDGAVSFDPQSLRLDCPEGAKHLSDHYFGFLVLRPTGIGTIGRSVLSPDIRTGAPRFIISADHKVHLLGYKLSVQGFPSMDQHKDISVCAHASCWSILRHYSERYSVYREFLTYEITVMAQEFDPGGLVPSRGLDVAHAERVFQSAGTFPIHVARSASGLADTSFYRQLIAYVESGFPLFAAMHGRNHAVAVIGHEWRPPTVSRPLGLRHAWDELSALAVTDDNHLPYLSIAPSGGTPYSAEDIDAFILALPEKVYYPADAVDRLAPALFKLGSLIGMPREDETILRYFITTGSALRKFVREHASEFDSKLVEAVMTLPFAQFVWVVEFATHDQWDVGQVTARAVLDATASVRDAFPMWLFHNTQNALLFDRRNIGTPGIRQLPLSTGAATAMSRMNQNLRPTQTQ